MKINGQIKHRKGRVNPSALYVDIPVEHEDVTQTVEVYVAPTYLEARIVEGKPQGKAVTAPKAKKEEPGEKLLGGEALKDAEAAATKVVVERLRKHLIKLAKASDLLTTDVIDGVREELKAILKDAK